MTPNPVGNLGWHRSGNSVIPFCEAHSAVIAHVETTIDGDIVVTCVPCGSRALFVGSAEEFRVLR